MKKYKICSIAMTMLSLSMCAVLTGCGRTKINLNDYLTVDYNGYDTVGTASSSFDLDRMITENPSAFGLKGEVSEMDLLGVEMQIADSLKGTLNQTSNLSNGDNITYQWNISDEESIKEKYPVDFSHEDTSYTISGLEQPEEFDPFENITIEYSGIAPNGTANINTSGAVVDGLIYMADKTADLKNGDVITITVSASDNSSSNSPAWTDYVDESEIYGYELDDEGYEGYIDSNGDFHRFEDVVKENNNNNNNNNNNSNIDSNLKNYCRKKGKIPTVSEKEYTVDGLTSYVMAIDEIPKDMQEKMQSQANDSLQSYSAGWEEDVSMKESEFIGYYLLTAKEGFSANPYNTIYLVYRYTASIHAYVRGGSSDEKVDGEETYYIFYRYSDIKLLEDGTCSVDLSSGKMCDNSCESNYGYPSGWGFSVFYKFKGYPDLDSMFNECVTKNIETYNYENTVAES